ncbi:MAG: acyl-CoA dehydrogenase [Proteobacteria bacterium]|nr:acyl-CoA dehydrogenase [Pseudomonadota bacterium]MCP4922149.1 acyl-CoA dehydrogenase [Pseudomonadota bacterium]
MSRDLIRAWIEENAPASLRGTASTPFQGYWGGNSEFMSADQRLWFERCLERGWTAPKWPVEYGGGGMSVEEHRTWTEELQRLRMPLPLVGIGLTMIGPILLEAGSEAQKAEHLPPIIRGELRWCQGYSEPEAGSDLASLVCSTRFEGDEIIVNGQKIWTSHAEVSDWIFCLVRTDTSTKHGGISFLLIDMTSPGITTRTIELISGASPFCEVFLDDVRVPASNLVGEVNKGWGVAKALLRHERGMVGESIAAGGARLPVLQRWTLRDAAIERIGLVDGRLADPLLRDRIAQAEMDQECMRLTVKRANDKLKAGDNPGAETSILKIAGTELNQRRWDIGMAIAGPDGLGWEGDDYTDIDRGLARQWLRSRGNSIEGGTNEIQRNIVARHVLGLPKQ